MCQATHGAQLLHWLDGSCNRKQRLPASSLARMHASVSRAVPTAAFRANGIDAALRRFRFRVFVWAPVCLFVCVMRSMPTTSTHTATCLCTRASPRRTGNLPDHCRLMPQCPLIATTYATHAWQDDPIASAPTSAPGLRPHPRRDCAHIRAGTVPTSAPGLRPHPRRDCAHIRAGTVPTSPPGLRPDLRGSSTLHPPGRELRVPTGAQLSD